MNLFLDAKSIEDFVSLATYIHDRVNTYLYIYAMSVALLHRKDTTNVPIPSHLSLFPELYMDKAIFSQAREEENIVPVGSRVRNSTFLINWHLFFKKWYLTVLFVKQRVPPSHLPHTILYFQNVIDVPPDFTASHLDLEHRVAYWREDVGVNLHHWHWHLVYPLDGRREIVNKDRRGELFYYMHEQIIARLAVRSRRLVFFFSPIGCSLSF